MPVTLERVSEHTFVPAFVPEGATVVDLGMNEGRFALEMQRRWRARVVGVEPNPVLCRRLIEGHGLRCYNYAIAERHGEVSLWVDEGYSEASSLYRSAPGRVETRVTAVTFAEFCAEADLHEIDLLKVDIEGAEIPLFQGTDPALFERVKQICVEFHAFIWPEHRPLIHEIMARMRERGFHVLDFSRNLSNVLFVNPVCDLSTLAKLAMQYDKYRDGLQRMWQGEGRAR